MIAVCRLCGATRKEIWGSWLQTKGQDHPPSCGNFHYKKGFSFYTKNFHKRRLNACEVEQMGANADPYHTYDAAYDQGRWEAAKRFYGIE